MKRGQKTTDFYREELVGKFPRPDKGRSDGCALVKTIRVKVKPNARVSALDEPDGDGIWLARLKSPPVDGKANAELIALIARRFGCRKRAVTIKSGASARLKLIRIDED